MDYDSLYKIVIIGNSGVGKSCILLRFSDNTFREEELATIGVDFKIKTVQIDSSIIKLQIWDTAGQERFSTITSSYYRGANGIVVVYDVTNKHSFTQVNQWMKNVDDFAPKTCTRLLVANKIDLKDERVVSKKEGEELAKLYNVSFIETSAKDDNNIEKVFMTMSRAINETFKNDPTRKSPSLNLKKVDTSGKPKKKCCQII